MSATRRAVTLFALLAYLMLCSIGTGWVLCEGANGHVEFEALAAGCCGDDTPSNDETHEDDCGDCEDVLLAALAPAVEEHGDDAEVFDMDTLETTVVAACEVDASTTTHTHAYERGPPRPPPQQAMLHRDMVACTVLRL